MGARDLDLLPLAASVDEARAYLRLDGGGEDALVTAMLRSATAMAEGFTGAALMSRAVEEMVPVSGDWQRLTRTPVRSISGVEGLPAEGSAFALPVDAWTIEIDSDGDGWVRVMQPGIAGRVRVTYSAGLAATLGDLPEGLRHGVILLAGHLLRERDRPEGAEPPATVAALWRPWRRMRL